MVAELSPTERREVVENLQFLRQLDYQAEDVLTVIAEREPRDVVDFLCLRLYEPNEYAQALAEKEGAEYEELHFQLNKLQDPLSNVPKLMVQKTRKRYHKDSSLFEFRGAKLFQVIFPQFSETFQGALVKLVREGGDV